MFVQDGFLYLIVAKHKLTVYNSRQTSPLTVYFVHAQYDRKTYVL
jgi:hypothetical protein